MHEEKKTVFSYLFFNLNIDHVTKQFGTVISILPPLQSFWNPGPSPMQDLSEGTVLEQCHLVVKVSPEKGADPMTMDQSVVGRRIKRENGKKRT